MSISERKNSHIRVNLEKDVRSRVGNGFGKFRLVHNAFPEADYCAFSVEACFLGKVVSAPVFISSMTGGTEFGERINRILTEAAEALKIPFAIGSQRIYLDPEKPAEIFPVRNYAPNIPVLANVGAVQLNHGFSRDDYLRAVEMIEADALILHINPLQELIQKGGDRDFSGILKKIEALCSNFPVPIIAKEVGWGFSVENARNLWNAGISFLDVAGAGGTSWSQVECYVDGSEELIALAEPFSDWGIPTAECLVTIHEALPDFPLLASGGIQNGVECAKAVLLGAQLCGLAGVLLPTAAEGDTEAVCTLLQRIIEQYRIARFLSEGIERIQ